MARYALLSRRAREREKGRERERREKGGERETEKRRKRSRGRVYDSILTCAYLIYRPSRRHSSRPLGSILAEVRAIAPARRKLQLIATAASLKHIVAAATLGGGRPDTQQRFALRSQSIAASICYTQVSVARDFARFRKAGKLLDIISWLPDERVFRNSESAHVA